MNDVRNLMGNLHTHVEYKEFETALRAPGDSWSVLRRINQATDDVAAAVEAPTLDARGLEAPLPAEGASLGLRRRSLLGRYAPETPAAPVEADAVRKLPLAEVFARLGRAGV